MSISSTSTIQAIPIEQIQVVNPRERGKHKFEQIVDSIAKLGLKRPIVVTPQKPPNPPFLYDLICGQGRMEGCKAAGATVVYALVMEATREELLLMSLIENLARKRFRAVELAKEIAAMKERGNDYASIAQKTSLDTSYVRGIIRLLSKGEERLLQAVDRGQIPINVAITIACSDDEAVQRALTEAYENKNLRGRALLKARRLIDLRRSRGKAGHSGAQDHAVSEVSADRILKTYQQEMNRQRMMLSKAKICETRLLFIVSGLKSLFQDENFVNLLRAESLDSLPQYLADQITRKAA